MNNQSMPTAHIYPDSVGCPPAPRTPEETGVPFGFLTELVTKVLFLRGEMALIELVAHLKLQVGVVDRLLTFMRAEKICEPHRRGSTGTDADLCYSLTELGRARANQFLMKSGYAGSAPVTLSAYSAQVRTQTIVEMHTTSAGMLAEFSDLGDRSRHAGPVRRGHEFGKGDLRARSRRQRQDFPGRTPERGSSGQRLANTSIANLVVYASAIGLLCFRLLREEKHLALDPEYCASI